MPYQEHDSIDSVPDSKKIWRYYSTSKFLSLIETDSLFLSRIDQFDDPFEGYAPVQNLKKEADNQQNLKENLDKLYSQTSAGEYPEDRNAGEKVSQVYEMIRSNSLASCWCMAESDSLVMWNSYIPSGDGVAISTTFGNLKSAIRNGEDFDYYAGEVNYYDYFGDFLGTTNYFDYVMSKPKQYEFEKELRLLMWWPEHGDTDPDIGPNGVLVDRDPAPEGKSFEININQLIDEVYLSPFSPPWQSVNVWENLLSDAGVNATVETSDLEMEPGDYV
jgi:hypothetical protein